MSVANDYKFSSPIVIGSGSIPRSHFVLHARSEEVGRLQIVDGVMCFTGNTDAAARVMLDYFLEQFNQQIKAYGQQCREAALKDAAFICNGEQWRNESKVSVAYIKAFNEGCTNCEEAIRRLK